MFFLYWRELEISGDNWELLPIGFARRKITLQFKNCQIQFNRLLSQDWRWEQISNYFWSACFQFSPFVEEQRRFAMLMLKCTFQKNKVKEAVNFVDKSGNKLQFLILYNWSDGKENDLKLIQPDQHGTQKVKVKVRWEFNVNIKRLGKDCNAKQ